MKALFDPLIPRKVLLATAPEIFSAGKAAAEAEKVAIDARAAEDGRQSGDQRRVTRHYRCA